MIGIGNLLICVLQVTLVAAFGIAFSLIMRRSLKASAGLPLVATLLSVILLTICSFSSWPSWLHRSSGDFAPTAITLGNFESELDDITQPSAQVDPMTRRSESRIQASTTEALSSLMAWVEDMSAANFHSEDTDTLNTWSLGQVVGLLVVLCFIVGLVRLVGGLVGVQMFVRGSRPLENRQMREQVDLIQAELGCNRKIVVRESNKLSLAATVGWRRPVVLLSDNWRTWTDIQLRSILAHEIAHIRRGDFMATLVAQIGLILHFYHPLVHWLANRLRLEQELAADAMAARIVGGSRDYLDAIGELALKHSSEPVGWPAHSFLPTRRTFLRRIEMLRDLKFLLVEGSGTIRWATSIGVLAVTLVAIGLRPPGNSPPSMNLKAQVPVAAPKQDVPEKLEPLTAKFVPEDATLIAVIRPRVIYSKVENLALSKLLPANMLKPLEMTKDVVQATIVCVPRGEQTMPQLATFLTFSNKEARDRFVAGSSPQGDRWLKTKLMLYEYEVAADGQTARYRPDDLTLVMGQTLAVQKMVLTAGKSLSLLTQTESWKKASNGVLAASASPSVLSDFAPQIEQNPVAGMFSPLWDTAVNHTLGLTMGDRLRIQLMSNSKNSDSAKKIEATMQAAISMFSNMLSSAKKTPDEKSQMTVEALSNLLASHKLEVSGTECRLSLEMDSENFAKFLVEPLAAAKSAGDRAAQTNNVKYIMLALHTYHDAYGSFPAAVVVDPASGMQRSWRVELLPYLDGTVGLYDQYKKNEPWDSPANMDVLAKMPAVFRHPSQPNDSTKTAVTAAYGEGLLFNRTTKGNRISQVLDGTSNTLAILEAKTEIPWTKPEDIEIDCNADKLPDFGGFDETGFIVGYADGSVRYFSKSIDTELLKKLFTIAGGEVIP